MITFRRIAPGLVATLLTASSALAADAPKTEATHPAATVTKEAPAKPAAGKTEVSWYGQATFVVKTPGGTVLVLDPWFDNPVAKDPTYRPEKADFILITHGHFDHINNATEVAKKTGAKLVASADLAAGLIAAKGFPKDQATFATTGNIGGTIQLNDEVSVTMVPAMHSSDIVKDDGTPVPGGHALGFVIQIKNGPTIYDTGDTDVFGDMKMIGERFKVDVMLAGIGGHFGMDPAGAAAAVAMVHPKQVVPMHFGTFPILTGTPAELEKDMKAKRVTAKMTTMTIGETKSF